MSKRKPAATSIVLTDEQVRDLRSDGNLWMFKYVNPPPTLPGGAPFGPQCQCRSYGGVHFAIFIPDLEPAGDVCRLPKCPFGKPDDLLWVRETWGAVNFGEPDRSVPVEQCTIVYRADLRRGSRGQPGGCPSYSTRGDDGAPKWRASTTMAQWASREEVRTATVSVDRDRDLHWYWHTKLELIVA